MAENSGSSAIFANRYRFQPVRDDWDTGRSGFTHLVFDHKMERLGVIKRAELKNQKAVDGLKNEVGALVDLKGRGVPEVYDTGEAEYGSKNYFYMIIEFIDALRIENNLGILSAFERIEIIRQLFRLLAGAHGMGIVNGDVDLKHLFWRKDKKQLVVIDWGNSKLDVNKKMDTEFAYDLARAAEIVHVLVTRKGVLPATGSLALPDDKSLLPGIGSVPNELRDLCKWAPRSPTSGAIAPHNAGRLFEASKMWRTSTSEPARNFKWVFTTLFAVLIIASFGWFLTVGGGWGKIQSLLSTPTPISTEITASALPETPDPTDTPPSEPTPTNTAIPSTEITVVVPTDTPAPIVTPTPRTYDQALLLFDQSNAPESNCWVNNPADTGFSRRGDGNWRFIVEEDTPKTDPVQTGFSKCLDVNQVGAFALNIWVPQIEMETDLAPGKELGIFIISANGQRRDYTIWIDRNATMHLSVRENDNIMLDEKIAIVDDKILKTEDVHPRKLASFPIQFFVELDNQGLDIIYLKQGPQQQKVGVAELDPGNMLPIHSAVLFSLGEIQEIGLIGYGGEIQTVIWPLVFFGNQ